MGRGVSMAPSRHEPLTWTPMSSAMSPMPGRELSLWTTVVPLSLSDLNQLLIQSLFLKQQLLQVCPVCTRGSFSKARITDLSP